MESDVAPAGGLSSGPLIPSSDPLIVLTELFLWDSFPWSRFAYLNLFAVRVIPTLVCGPEGQGPSHGLRRERTLGSSLSRVNRIVFFVSAPKKSNVATRR